MRTIASIVFLLQACDAAPGTGVDMLQPLPDLATTDATFVLQPIVRITNTPTPSQIHLNNGKAVAVDDGGIVHVVWQEVLEAGPSEGFADQGQVYYARSTDQGRSFSSPAPLWMPNPVPQQGAPRLAVAGGSVFVTWFENDGTLFRVVNLTSTDGGLTWDPRVTVMNGSFPSVAAYSDGASPPSVYVVCNDPQVQGGVSEIYLAKSSDGGKTFAPRVMVSSDDAHSSWTATVAAWGQRVHVAWSDERDNIVGGVLHDCGVAGGACNEEEYYRGSQDGAATWGPEVRLTTDPVDQPTPSWCPTIAADHDAVHVAYFDLRTGNWKVYYRRSLDGGGSFGAEVSLTDLLGGQPAGQWLRPSLAVDGTKAQIVFWQSDQMYAGIHAGAIAEVYSFGSDDNGDTWGAAEKISAGTSAYYPAVALGHDRSIHWLWFDSPDGNDEIYYRRFGP